MKIIKVLSMALITILILTITGIIVSANEGSCSIESDPGVQFIDDPLSNRIDDILTKDKTVFLFFYSDWCPFCHQQMPVIDKMEERYAGEVTFIRINITERPDHAEEFNVSALPTMVVISGMTEEGMSKRRSRASQRQRS